MSNYFDRKLTYNGITFRLTDNPVPDEREIHSYHEILYFLDGKAELLTENSRVEIKNHTLFVIPKETYHFIKLHTGKFLRLKISIPDSKKGEIPLCEIMSSFRSVNNLPDGVLFVLNRLLRIIESDNTEKQGFYLYSAFLMLIEELDSHIDGQYEMHEGKIGIAQKITDYVSANLSSDLSVEAIADYLNISRSGVLHHFKRELGISLHNYITQKRLIRARELIREGKKPSKIYTDCGYLEYSSFYRAYVKFFGASPQSDKNYKSNIDG